MLNHIERWKGLPIVKELEGRCHAGSGLGGFLT